MTETRTWKAGRLLFFFILTVFILAMAYRVPVKAGSSSGKKKAYVNALSKVMMDGTVTKKMDIYRKVSQGETGKECLRKAALANRAAIMAEGIDFLDANWSQYYAVNKQGTHVVFNSTKLVSRKKFRKRYRKIKKGLREVLSCVDSSMSKADKALAVYIYLAENTVYKESKDAHTGYDVLVKHTGVCDGLANAYALAMSELEIPCTVVSNYTKNHSWNMVKLDGKWYFVDLTNGVSSKGRTGMALSYESCLVGKSTFLKTHSGYKKKDIYGQGNSNGLAMRKIKIASADYIRKNSEIRTAIEGRTCLFYRCGYWYWISTDNKIKYSRLRSKKGSVFYAPMSDRYIGWIKKYNGYMLLSLNGGIYRMDFKSKRPVLLKYVAAVEYNKNTADLLWDIIYIGGFKVSAKGKIIYYVCDFSGIRKGKAKVYTVTK